MKLKHLSLKLVWAIITIFIRCLKLKVELKQVQLEGTPPRKLRNEITQYTYLIKSIQKFRFPSTYLYLHPDNHLSFIRYQFSLEIRINK